MLLRGQLIWRHWLRFGAFTVVHAGMTALLTVEFGFQSMGFIHASHVGLGVLAGDVATLLWCPIACPALFWPTPWLTPGTFPLLLILLLANSAAWVAVGARLLRRIRQREARGHPPWAEQFRSPL
jgi:hypothetical protein